MKVALVNPPWSFEGSIYFGCREPHLPLELGYAAGHAAARRATQTLLIDGQLFGRSTPRGCQPRLSVSAPDMTVVTTAPTYLFWRCAPPELRVPAEFLRRLGKRGGRTVAVGPHGSVTPAATLRKLGADAVVRGECEEVIAALADARDWSKVASIAYSSDGQMRINGGPAAVSFADLPPLRWPDAWVAPAPASSSPLRRRRDAASARRSRRRAAAPTTVVSAPRSISATSIAAATWRHCWPRSTG